MTTSPPIERQALSCPEEHGQTPDALGRGFAETSIAGFATSDQSGAQTAVLRALRGSEMHLRRLLFGHIEDELRRAGNRGRDIASSETWTDETQLGPDGLGFDSLSLLDLVSRLNHVFALHRTGIEDYLFIAPTLGAWLDLVNKHLEMLEAEPDVCLGFWTSGSTGQPKAIAHPIADLFAEVLAHSGILNEAGRIVSTVPGHHIYGFLFGILLPLVKGWDCLDVTRRGPGRVAAGLRAGDIVIATPHIWAALCRSSVRLSPGVTGVTSGAPASAELWHQTRDAGLSRLVEIFGSSETAGIGWRESGDAPFELLANLDRDAEGAILRHGGVTTLSLQDELEWRGPRHFRTVGRKDSAVQVGGMNVFPDRVAATLAADDGVSAAAVRLDGPPDTARLKAFVVPVAQSVDLGALEARLRKKMGEEIPSARPQSYRFGPALPRNAMGKLCDWSV